jgi:hypothetical protein
MHKQHVGGGSRAALAINGGRSFGSGEMNKRVSICLALLALSMASSQAQAHHSGAMFDRSKTVELKGTVKDYQFANPHSWIDVSVSDADGKVQTWAIEAQTPSYMRMLGVTPSILKAGDMVTIRAHPLRDGRPGGSFVDVTMADGKTLGAQHGLNLGTGASSSAAFK